MSSEALGIDRQLLWANQPYSGSHMRIYAVLVGDQKE